MVAVAMATRMIPTRAIAGTFPADMIRGRSGGDEGPADASHSVERGSNELSTAGTSLILRAAAR